MEAWLVLAGFVVSNVASFIFGVLFGRKNRRGVEVAVNTAQKVKQKAVKKLD